MADNMRGHEDEEEAALGVDGNWVELLQAS